ncbi:MAG: hypothetical protein ACKO0V_18295 [bacterium]
MVLRTVILPGVDPSDILRKNMSMSVVMAASPLFLFMVSEILSGNFSGFTSKNTHSVEMFFVGMAYLMMAVAFPISFKIQAKGLRQISEYLSRNNQILERQLMGALVRVYRTSQLYRMSLLLAATMIGLIALSINRSQAGLLLYLIGQGAMIYCLPWPARCELWLEVKRRQVLN